MVKRAVLFTNGDLADASRLKLKKTDYLIGVDGGTNLIRRLGLKPDLAIGDFDSYPKPKTKAVFKQSQDLTDTEFALDYCVKQGFKEIVLVGVLGRRLDHLLANIFLAVKFKLTIYEGQQVLYFITGPSSRVLEGRRGDLISLLPLTNCLGITSKGLKWTLQVEYLKFSCTRGISNVMTGKTCRVSLKKGRLLVVYNKI
ncbi:thiamine diphosphokinase [Candidatus Beckwithbacteria bacterium CG22_combo_CG10-13_8_21_14_all_01_47_9]|uniref:Thiamine diphosphokinase n=4 Tax=Candidatus Beckwithiibacteriota TaxID=1752726 RepID=A0A2H0E0D9_9BACT|nr:MAG: thiamine diphosphokinase [Candidatus Beckwithbacteria bacterium CG1_02_47_37]PIP87904.1 MAG: thiamine diphosphokinase [Candidatus Beckwithbacteria bacterium CG22_combo_CG10-13_8_21_14_all_01_47_9]PJA23226.1 MAG: thiamine diphosphokinase [Candidatus Beckwithbacteria bacterium CG_4_10_14_0_2_um_filter_47_25]PJC66462.1 MAG: thiamine diphosphokinase [Candidatus Beckwithbacteria bacterium CG_4_9_14_0_2_um_filter_47_11]